MTPACEYSHIWEPLVCQYTHNLSHFSPANSILNPNNYSCTLTGGVRLIPFYTETTRVAINPNEVCYVTEREGEVGESFCAGNDEQ